MNYYIFLTNEGSTYQTNSRNIEPDCENAQLIGIANGSNSDEAINNLKKENANLLDSNFNEIYCYELKGNIDNKKFYYLKK